MSFVIQAAGNTDIGLVRKNNEDNFGYDLRHGIFVVCDGMGGQQAGELASKIAVDTVLDYFRQDRNVAPVGGAKFEGVSPRAVGLAGAIQLANQAIHESGARIFTMRAWVRRLSRSRSRAISFPLPTSATVAFT